MTTDRFNRICETNFTVEQMDFIYTYSCNGINHELTKQFVKSGFDISVIKKFVEERGITVMNKCDDCLRSETCVERRGSHKYCFIQKPKTNYSRIMSMSVEEMVLEIMTALDVAEVCKFCKPTGYIRNTTHCNDKCSDGIKQWLESEIENDVGEKLDFEPCDDYELLYADGDHEVECPKPAERRKISRTILLGKELTNG